MHSFVGVIDTRPRGSRHGIKRTCPHCHRKHVRWALFREVRLEDVPGEPGMVRYTPTGKTVTTGTECAKKVTVPIWNDYQREAVLQALDMKALRPGDPTYDKLFTEFR